MSRRRPVLEGVHQTQRGYLELGGAGSYREGLSTPAGPFGGRVLQLFRLGPTGDAYAEEPAPMLVSVSYETTSVAWTGRFDVVALVTFCTGAVTHTMEVDVPARGTSFSVPAADGLEVKVIAEGTSDDAIANVRAGVCYLGAGHPRGGRRTLRWALPAEDAVIKRIPPFSRSVSAVSPIGLASISTIEILGQPIVGAGDTLGLYTVAQLLAAAAPLSAGADSARVNNADADTVRLVFELAP